jgi:hypothetical protein
MPRHSIFDFLKRWSPRCDTPFDPTAAASFETAAIARGKTRGNALEAAPQELCYVESRSQ